VIPTSAYIKFRPDGVAAVDAGLRLSGASFIMCCTYPDQPPILSVDDRHVSVTVTVPDSARVTPEDLDTARRLAAAVTAYIAELENRIATQGPAADEGEAA
jgi:hypothetical protein